MARIPSSANCPLCDAILRQNWSGDPQLHIVTAFDCPNCGRFYAKPQMLTDLDSKGRAVLSHTIWLGQTEDGDGYRIDVPQIEEAEKGMLPTSAEQLNLLLLFFGKRQETVGSVIKETWGNLRAKIGAIYEDDVDFILKWAQDEGLIEESGKPRLYEGRLTPSGWQRFEEQKETRHVPQSNGCEASEPNASVGSVAEAHWMDFDEGVEFIFRLACGLAVAESSAVYSSHFLRAMASMKIAFHHTMQKLGSSCMSLEETNKYMLSENELLNSPLNCSGYLHAGLSQITKRLGPNEKICPGDLFSVIVGNAQSREAARLKTRLGGMQGTVRERLEQFEAKLSDNAIQTQIAVYKKGNDSSMRENEIRKQVLVHVYDETPLSNDEHALCFVDLADFAKRFPLDMNEFISKVILPLKDKGFLETAAENPLLVRLTDKDIYSYLDNLDDYFPAEEEAAGTSLSEAQKKPAIEVFVAFSTKDDEHRETLLNHLSPLKREGKVSIWHCRKIDAGEEWESEINQHINSAGLILLLISADFFASNYCYEKEMTRALERHRAGDAKVIPIILRDCDWQHSPLATLQALPTDGKPIISWTNWDDGYADVARGIRAAIGKK